MRPHYLCDCAARYTYRKKILWNLPLAQWTAVPPRLRHFSTMTQRSYCVNWASRSRRFVRSSCMWSPYSERAERGGGRIDCNGLCASAPYTRRRRSSSCCCCWQLRRCGVPCRICSSDASVTDAGRSSEASKHTYVRLSGELWTDSVPTANATAGHRCYLHCSPVSRCCFRPSSVYS